jgi:hypothetical protein
MTKSLVHSVFLSKACVRREYRLAHTWMRRPPRKSPAPEQTLDPVAVGHPGTPERLGKRHPLLSADRGYDSDPLRPRNARRGTDPIIPDPATSSGHSGWNQGIEG